MKIRYMLVLTAMAGAVACGGEEQGERVELGEPQQQEARSGGRESWPEGLAARVDSGNTAYAEEDYETAEAIFTAITDDYPELGVAWFGLSMAQRAQGDTAAANESSAKAEQYSPGLGRMHEAATHSTQRVPMEMQGHPQLPAGHPTTEGGEAPPLEDVMGG